MPEELQMILGWTAIISYCVAWYWVVRLLFGRRRLLLAFACFAVCACLLPQLAMEALLAYPGPWRWVILGMLYALPFATLGLYGIRTWLARRRARNEAEALAPDR